MPIPITNRIKRYASWRKREPVARPMLGLIWEPDVLPLPEMVEQIGHGNRVSPDYIHPEMFLPHIEQWHREDCELQCDVIQSFGPSFGIPWTEAIAGCPVVAQTGSLWAEPSLENYSAHSKIRLDASNPWLCKLLECTDTLVRFANGRFPVSLPIMRGPLDILAAMRTPQQMCLDFIDRPKEVVRVLEELTDLWLNVAEAVLAIIPPFHGGYCTRVNMWVPDKAITPQNDVSSLVSRGMYEELVLTCDRRIIHYFPYHSFHLHSTEYHQIDALLGLEELTALQVFLEPESGGPAMETMMPIVRRALNHKPLLLGAPNTEVAEQCLGELPSAGLCLVLSSEQNHIPDEYTAWLEQHCQCRKGESNGVTRSSSTMRH